MNQLPPYTITIATLVLVLVGLLILLRINLAERRLRLGQIDSKSGDKKSFDLLNADQRAELERIARENFQTVIQQSVSQLTVELKEVSSQLKQQIQALTTNVIEQELEEYQKVMNEARIRQVQALGRAETAVSENQKELQSKIEAELKTEKARLVAKIDQHLSDIISAYIVESLGQGIDLGAQAEYIFRSLEAHKAELKEELSK